MKCTICGCEIQQGEQVCQNCGTRVLEMNLRKQNQRQDQPLGYGSVNNNYYQSNYSSNYNGAGSGKIQRSGGGSALIVFLVIVFLAVGGFFAYRNFGWQTCNFSGGSIKIPIDMEEISHVSSTVCAYRNDDMTFLVTSDTIDTEALKAYGISGNDLFAYAAAMNSGTDFDVMERTDDYICIQTNSTYSVMHVELINNKMIICSFTCSKDDKDEHSAEMKKYIKTYEEK